MGTMGTGRIDWRWLAVLLLGGAFLTQVNAFAAAALLAVAAYLALRAGNLTWGRGPVRGRNAKETYWRGRRID